MRGERTDRLIIQLEPVLIEGLSDAGYPLQPTAPLREPDVICLVEIDTIAPLSLCLVAGCVGSVQHGGEIFLAPPDLDEAYTNPYGVGLAITHKPEILNGP